MRNDEEIRDLAINALASKGYDIEMVGSGSGVPKSSRLIIKKPGLLPKKCVVKVTTTGRISFQYKHGQWAPLHETDYVLYAHNKSNGKICVQMFSRNVIETAFNTLRDALTVKGREHIPHWLAPFKEEGERFTGSGFGSEADWTIDIDPAAVSVPAAVSPLPDAIEQAKEIIARALGRRPNEIDLTVSFRT